MNEQQRDRQSARRSWTAMERQEYLLGFGARLRGVREELGWSAPQVERESEGAIREDVLRSYERAGSPSGRVPTVEQAAFIAGFYGVPTSRLLVEPDDGAGTALGGSVRLADGSEPRSAPHRVAPGAVRASEGSTAVEALELEEAS